MDLKTDSYSSCLLYLKDSHGFSEGDLSNLLEVPQEVIKFFINPEEVRKLDLLKEVLQKEGHI
ncbi:hypothetical protein [Legionella sp. W05-934-2]|uniref:hypothetical protein n=1 Tax=Legionella sp. W05-934-2 TaxID=1198649 RepID=UPI0034623C43